MNIRKWITALFMAAALALFVPALVPALGTAGTAAAAGASGTGWRTDANGTYYLANGKKVKGWKTIGGRRYYFKKKNGYRATGTFTVGGKCYLFRPEAASNSGALCKGISGLVRFSCEPNIYYYLKTDKSGAVATSQWLTVKGGKYYANSKGQIKLGTIKLKGKLYHITPKGRMTFYGRSTYDKKYYYAGANGVLKTGRQKINGKLYYFDKKTGQRMGGLTLKIGKYYVYFKKKDGAAKAGWLKISNDEVYYYTQYFHRVSGWRTINGKRYYFDPANDDRRVQNCWKVINGKYYYFRSNGVVQTGLFKIGEDVYYADTTGARQYGWATVSGYRYYLDPVTGIMRTGWFTDSNGKKYYLNPTVTDRTYGAAYIGLQSISGYRYYFESDGAMHTGWLVLNNLRYYFDPQNGYMYTGTHTVDGKTYNFGTSGGISVEPTGAWRIEVNRARCFVVVYRGDTAVKAFVCSTAANRTNTPTGTFYLLDKLPWHELNGPSWGQYCSHITPDILFHSVPNLKYKDNHSLNAAAYNKLGEPASGGCIRLTVKHAKYLYDNCPIGTKVIISDSVSLPSYIPLETAQKIPLTQNYDPTDPDA